MQSINEIDESILVGSAANVAGDIAGQAGKLALEPSPAAGVACFAKAGFDCAGKGRWGEC
jgi:hypothetical protein